MDQDKEDTPIFEKHNDLLHGESSGRAKATKLVRLVLKFKINLFLMIKSLFSVFKKSVGFCNCGDYVLVGRCWTSCNLFPIRNLAVSQHVSSIVRFFIFFQSFPTFCYFVDHLLLRSGTSRFFRNRRCDFQQSNVAMLVFCLFC